MKKLFITLFTLSLIGKVFGSFASELPLIVAEESDEMPLMVPDDGKEMLVLNPENEQPAEFISAPGGDKVWIKGEWTWKNRWVWRKGRWVNRPYPGANWDAGHWLIKGHHCIWLNGRWR